MIHKFRAWDIEKAQMIYYTWEEMIDAAVSTELCNYTITENVSDLIRVTENDYSEQMRMQYVGISDMNGTDIYVGDIIRKEMCSPDDMAYGFYGSIGVVIYDDGAMGFVIDTTDTGDEGFYDTRGINFTSENIEVIGNIYKTPRFYNDWSKGLSSIRTNIIT